MVNLGVISTSNESYPRYEFLARLAENDLNRICNESGLDLKFVFNVSSGEGSPARALDLLWDQWSRGVSLFVAGGYTSQLTVMYSFVNDNEIIVISPSCSNVQLNQSDYIFRLSPSDSTSGNIMAYVSKVYGVDEMVILARNDSWTRYIGDKFSEEFTELDGVIIGKIVYQFFDESEFDEHLDKGRALGVFRFY